MKTTLIGVSQARIHLSKLIDRVLDGEKIIVTRFGKPLIELQELPETKKKRELGFLDFEIVGDDFAERCMEKLDLDWGL